MRRILALLLAALFATAPFASAPAWADDDDEGESVSGGKMPPMPGSVRMESPSFPASEPMEGQYLARIAEGARILKMDVAFVDQCWKGMEGLYKRDYAGAKKAFEDAGARWRGSGVGPIGQALVWQALMLENFDFKYDSQYRNAYNRGRQELEVALQTPGNEIWENFMLGAILGVDSIHTMRKEEFLTAINRGVEAMRYVNRAKQMAPAFVDAQLGDGLWLYWSSAISLTVPGIPTFDDTRAQGIEMMQKAQKSSIFLRPAAAHALTYTWREEGRTDYALSLASTLAQKYPSNVINLLMLGRLQTYSKDFAASEATYKRVLGVDPRNERVHYYLQRLYLRWEKHDLAVRHADIYLGFNLSDYQRAYALYFKGNVYYNQQNWAAARACYEQAYKINKLKAARSRLERVQQKMAGG